MERRLAACAGCAVLLLAVPASAQEVEELTVTARKKEESLQEVPLSITAFSVDGLRQRNADSIYSIAEFTPNFSLNRNLGRRLDAPAIRGQFTPLVGTEPNAAFYVDGVFVTGSASSLVIDNLERVEILRGPQAALFGRASFAGAVNYITRKPTNEFTGEANFKAGENQDYKAAAWASGPIVPDKLLFFGSASYQKFGGEWRNGLEANEVNVTAFADNPGNINTSLSSFFGPFNWPAVPPSGCPPEYGTRGCPPQDADDTRLGGEQTINYTGKLTFTPTEAIELSAKVEFIDIEDGHFPAIYIAPYERQFDAQGNLLLNQFGFADLKPNLNAFLPVYDAANQIYIPSPGWYAGELDPDGFVSKLNLPNLRQGVTTANGTSPPSPFLGQEEDIQRYVLDGVFDLAGGWELTARWTEARINQLYYRDLDRTPALGPIANGLFEASELYGLRDKSAEVRVQSPVDARLSGLLGYYYYNKTQAFNQRNFNGFDGPDWRPGYDQTVNNYALFGSLTFAISDAWSLSAEGRYASDEITWASVDSAAIGQACRGSDPNLAPGDPGYDGELLPGDPAAYCDPVKGTRTFYSFTPRATLRYQPNDAMNFYGLVAKGNKPGGYNFPYFDTRVSRPYAWRNLDGDALIEEEEAWTYELGAKMLLAEGALQVNAAAFYIDWKNQAINVTRGIEFTGGNITPFAIIANAGKSHVKGVELETIWAATDNLTLALNYGWARNELDEYFDQELATLNCNLWGWEGFAPNLPFAGNVSDAAIEARCRAAGDASGKLAPRVPEHSANLSANYTGSLRAGLGWFARTDVTFESKKYNTVVNTAHTGNMYIWNARVGLDTEAWTLTFYVDNILDDDTVSLIQDFPLIDESRYQRWNPAQPFAWFQGRDGLVNPTSFLLTPRRSRNMGLLLQYRFGN